MHFLSAPISAPLIRGISQKATPLYPAMNIAKPLMARTTMDGRTAEAVASGYLSGARPLESSQVMAGTG